MQLFLKLSLLLHLTISCCLAQSTETLGLRYNELTTESLLLDQGWKFHPGDDAAWADPGFDDSHWQTVNPTGDIDHLTPLREAQIGWFRIHLRVDSALLTLPLALKIWQLGASQIYLNGKLIHQLGVVSKDKNKEILYNPKGNPLTFQFKGSVSQVIAVRYSFTQANSYLNFWGFGNSCLTIRIARMEQAIEQLLHDKSYKALIEFGKVGFLLFLGLLHFFFYLSYPKERTNLYHSLFTLSQSVGFLLAYFHYIPTGEFSFLIYFSENVMWLTFSLWGNMAVYSYAGRQRDYYFWLVVIGIPLTLFLAKWPYDLGGYFFPLYIGLAGLNASRVSLLAIKNQLPGSRLIFTGWCSWTVCFTLVYLLVYNIVSTPFNIDKVYLVDIFFHIGIICQSLPFSILLAWQYAQTNRSLQDSLIEVEVQRLEAEKMHELDRLKSHFFANISHEFRTPLTLISGTIEKLASKEKTFSERQEEYQLVSRNAQRLLQLINQLLDLSKLDAGKLGTDKQPGEVITFLQGVARSFASHFENKGITYWYNLPFEPLFARFDGDKLEKVLSNLLSNAFKFTSQGGKVVVSAIVVPKETSAVELQLSVQDTGIGISKERLPRIFERFYQVDTSPTRPYEGTGIGLALVKELVELQGGSIWAESSEGLGTTFHIKLPLEIVEPLEANQSEKFEGQEQKLPGKYMQTEIEPAVDMLTSAALKSYKIKLLVVEDNADLRRFISQSLTSRYQILEAENGLKGYEQALAVIPDLIISDVMMPGMDGVTLCKKLKTNELTSHIPLILLTARADMESKISGLEMGADDYLTKPFQIQELQVRVKNLIDSRKKLRERYSRSLTVEPTEVAVTSTDEKFLQKALSIIEANLSDTGFDVETFSKEIGMSRGHLHRKLTTLIDQSPSDFIRTIRLKRAARLLDKQAGNVSEVAFQVGFNSLTYFTKCFREFYGKTPSEYADKNSSLNESKP